MDMRTAVVTALCCLGIQGGKPSILFSRTGCLVAMGGYGSCWPQRTPLRETIDPKASRPTEKSAWRRRSRCAPGRLRTHLRHPAPAAPSRQPYNINLPTFFAAIVVYRCWRSCFSHRSELRNWSTTVLLTVIGVS
ncbi:MAG: hypothetical protein ACLT98_13935 [Eggerthellaceae bacterium]